MNSRSSMTDVRAPDVTHDPNRPPTIGPGGVDLASATMPRRSFLRNLGIGAATAFVLADVAVAYRAYDQGVLAEEQGPAFDAWNTWRDGDTAMSMVGAAVLAANAHNTQPWRFAVTERRIDLSADRERTTGANDALDRELDVSLGCALENLHLAAAARGRRTDIELAPDGRADLAATVLLRPAPAVDTALHRAIGDRHSNRSEYRSDPIPASVGARGHGRTRRRRGRPRPTGVAQRDPRPAAVR
jgi:nitroreductase